MARYRYEQQTFYSVLAKSFPQVVLETVESEEVYNLSNLYGGMLGGPCVIILSYCC